MPQVQIYNDVCGKIKINFPMDAVTFAEDQYTDSDGRYFLADTASLDSQLEVVLEIIPPNQNYSGYGMYVRGSSFVENLNVIPGTQDYEINSQAFINTLSAFSGNKYLRLEEDTQNIPDPSGGFFNVTYYQFISYYEYTNYDNDPNGVIETVESIGGTLVKTSEGLRFEFGPLGQSVPLSSSENYPNIGLFTSDGCPINPATGEVGTGYRLLVKLGGEFPQILVSYLFIGDPRPITVQCLTQECPDGCLPLYDGNFENRMCICQPVNGVPVVDEWPNLDQDSRTWDDFS